MRHSNAFARASVAALLVALAAGCSASTTTTQSSSSASADASGATAAPAGDGQIKIGVDMPVSGADASTGIPTRNGAVLAIEQASKAAPKGFTFAAYDLDDAVQGAHDPAQGAQNVKSFISDASVLAMVGPFNSNVAKAEIPLTNDAGLAQISPDNTSVGLTKGPDAKSLRQSHPDANAYFRVSTTDDKQGDAAARFARKLKFAKAFVIDDDETYGKGLADVFETQFGKLGGTVAGHEHVTKGQTDFKALLTKAAALRPDVVFFGGTTSTGGGLLRKQMPDAGLGSVAYIGGDGISDQEFLTTAGTSANGSYYTVAAPNTAKLASAKTFSAQYAARFHSPEGPYSAAAYSAALIEIAAIDKAIASDGGKMPTRAQVLANVAATKNSKTPIGVVGFDPNGDTTNPMLSLYEVEGGKSAFVDQISLKP